MLLAGLLSVSPALADNERYGATTRYCEGAACVDNGGWGPTPLQATDGKAGASAFSVFGGQANASVSFNPGAPTLLTEDKYSAGAQADVFYTFQVKGAVNTYVPVSVGANASVGAIHAADYLGNPYQLADDPRYPGDNDGVAAPGGFSLLSDARILVYQYSTGAGFDYHRSNSLDMVFDYDHPYGSARNTEGDGIQINQVFYFLSNTDITVNLHADAGFNYLNGYDPAAHPQFASVTARADPTFTIADSAFSGFDIVGVPGGDAATPSAVPEPATWAVMFGGFFVVGSAMRRSRASVHFA
jgi:hypothetical protein